MARNSIGRSTRPNTTPTTTQWCPPSRNDSNWRDITTDNQRTYATCGDCGNRVSVKN